MTNASNYYARQAQPQLGPVAEPDANRLYGLVTGFVFVGCLGFCLGMVLAAAMAGVL